MLTSATQTARGLVVQVNASSWPTRMGTNGDDATSGSLADLAAMEFRGVRGEPRRTLMVCVKDTATAPSEMLVSVLPSVWMAASGRICSSCLPVICTLTRHRLEPCTTAERGFGERQVVCVGVDRHVGGARMIVRRSDSCLLLGVAARGRRSAETSEEQGHAPPWASRAG